MNTEKSKKSSAPPKTGENLREYCKKADRYLKEFKGVTMRYRRGEELNFYESIEPVKGPWWTPDGTEHNAEGTLIFVMNLKPGEVQVMDADSLPEVAEEE